jgi:hypothetical protein
MFVYLKGMLSKSTRFLVVTITPAPEVAGGKEVVDNGIYAGALGRAEDLTDPVLSISHSRYGFSILYSPYTEFLLREWQISGHIPFILEVLLAEIRL